MLTSLRWRPRLRVGGLVAGSVAGLAAVVLVQQYGLAPLTRAVALQGASAGVLSGVLIPSGIYAGVVRVHNRRLATHLAIMTAHGAAASAMALLVTFVAMGAGAFLAGSDRADAVLAGTCDATINDRDARALPDNASGALEVPSDGTVDVLLHTPEDIATYRFWVTYVGTEITIASGAGTAESADDGGGTLAVTVPLEDLSWMGTGLYEVNGTAATASGDLCSGSFYLRVTGSPLSTPIGQAAAAAALAGVAGSAMSARGAARDGNDLLDELDASLNEEAAAASALANEADAPDSTDATPGGSGAHDADSAGAGPASEQAAPSTETPPGEPPGEPPAAQDLSVAPVPIEPPDPFADPFEDPLQTTDPIEDLGAAADDPFGNDPNGSDPFGPLDDPFSDG